jgi:hypothetical protein
MLKILDFRRKSFNTEDAEKNMRKPETTAGTAVLEPV